MLGTNEQIPIIQKPFNLLLRDVMMLCEVVGNEPLKNAIRQRLFAFATDVGLEKGDKDGTK